MMMPKSILAGLMVSLLLGVEYTPELGAPLNSYRLGSAKYLEGRTVFYSMFVDTPESSWTQEDKEEALTELAVATDYIVEAAEDYHKDVEFIFDWNENPDLSGEATIDFPVSNEADFQDSLDAKISVWMKRTIPFETLLEESEADQYALLVFVHNPGTSYAIVYDGLDNPRESLIVFDEEPPSVYAHEILHLFGAHDLYAGAEYTKEVTDYVSQAYPQEIMYTAMGQESIEISPITAYHLGWIDYTEETDVFPQLRR